MGKIIKKIRSSDNERREEKKTNMLKRKHNIDKQVISQIVKKKNKVGIEQSKTTDVKAVKQNNERSSEATLSGVEQGYIVCPSEKRLMFLFTFLKKNSKKKVMVLFSSVMSVKFHYELFNYFDVPVKCIHEGQKESKRTVIFSHFCKVESGILMCTEVAIKGLDIPKIDWIVQYDPPDNLTDYTHRVRQTGDALLIVLPEELAILQSLKINSKELSFNWNKVAFIQQQLENLITKNYSLYLAAKEAFKAYIKSYKSHDLKKIYNFDNIDLAKVALSFGFKTPPGVNLDVSEGENQEHNNEISNKKEKKKLVFRQLKRRNVSFKKKNK